MQNRQIEIKKRIPKIISEIAATTILVALAGLLLPSFWFWVLFELFATLLVAVGCSGEWWLHHHPAGRKKNEKDEYHKLESRFIAAVSVGVIMECFVLGHSIREGVQLENAVSKANERATSNEVLVGKIGTTNAQLVVSNLLFAKRVEELRKQNDALAEKAAEFAKIITNTQNELEANEEPMDFSGPLPPAIAFFSGESSSMFHESLIKIPKMRVMLLNVLDIRAKYTANKLDAAFRWAGWDVTNRDAATAWLGIYIGVDGWVNSFMNDRENWPKTFPPNPCVQTGLRLLQLLTSNGLPAKIGEQVAGKWSPGESWPFPPNIDIVIPTNTILIVVGQRPYPLMTKYMLLEARKQLLGAGKREKWNDIHSKLPPGGGMVPPSDQAILDRIDADLIQINKQEAELQQEEKPRALHNRGHTN